MQYSGARNTSYHHISLIQCYFSLFFLPHLLLMVRGYQRKGYFRTLHLVTSEMLTLMMKAKRSFSKRCKEGLAKDLFRLKAAGGVTWGGPL